MERLWQVPGETESGRWIAAIPTLGGRGAKYGGELVLTSFRLVWVPHHFRTVLVTGDVVLPVEVAGDWWEIPLGAIDRVEADPKRHALLHVVGRDGIRTSFLVAASRFAATWNKKNRVARDDAVGRIQSAIDTQSLDSGRNSSI